MTRRTSRRSVNTQQLKYCECIYVKTSKPKVPESPLYLFHKAIYISLNSIHIFDTFVYVIVFIKGESANKAVSSVHG